VALTYKDFAVKIHSLPNDAFQQQQYATRTESNKRKRTPPRTVGDPPVTGQPKDDGSSTDSDIEKNTRTTRASARSTPAPLRVMASLDKNQGRFFCCKK